MARDVGFGGVHGPVELGRVVHLVGEEQALGARQQAHGAMQATEADIAGKMVEYVVAQRT